MINPLHESARPSLLVLNLLRGAYWFDDAMTKAQQLQGGRQYSRTQTFLLMNIALGRCKPTQLAEALGVTRQAVSRIISDFVEQKLLEVRPDPQDGRGVIVEMSDESSEAAAYTIEIMRKLEHQLGQRIGEDRLAVLRTAMSMDWGRPVLEETVCESECGGGGPEAGPQSGELIAKPLR
jgi:DNA-binding MarR family transcriptional regulator